MVGPIRRLDTGGGSGIYLCRRCWKDEMKWRKMRNRKLIGDARFPIRKFPTNKRGPNYNTIVTKVSDALNRLAAKNRGSR